MAKRAARGRDLEKRGGRPSPYDPVMTPRITRYAMANGATRTEIAQLLGVSTKTLTRWEKQHDAFREVLDRGCPAADMLVEASLFERAVGYTFKTEKIFYDKDEQEAVRVPVDEHLPPDVPAARYWLNNRQSEKWGERQRIEATISLADRLERARQRVSSSGSSEVVIASGVVGAGGSDGGRDDG